MGNLYGSLFKTIVIQLTQLPMPPSASIEYNCRPYNQRGWCQFEQGVAQLAAHHRSPGSDKRAIPKLVDISYDLPQPFMIPETDEALKQKTLKNTWDQIFLRAMAKVSWSDREEAMRCKEIKKNVDVATFTGKADKKVVMRMIDDFRQFLDYGGDISKHRVHPLEEGPIDTPVIEFDASVTPVM